MEKCGYLLLFSGFIFTLFVITEQLQANGKNVKTIVTYRSQRYTTKCKLFGWGRCTRYRQVSDTRYECKARYRSTDNIGCPHAICDGDINPKACKIQYSKSHIVYSDGSTQYNSGGRCDNNNPGQCLDCNAGFYNSRERCRMCTAITNCDLEECRTSSDQTCTRCEGVTRELPGHRAYVVSSNKKTCTQACSWRTDSTRCYPGTCAGEFASNCRCTSGFVGKHCETISQKPRISYNILRLTAGNGDTSEAPPNINSGPSQASTWSKITSPSSVYFKFTADFSVSSKPAEHAFIEGFRVGIIGGTATFITTRGGRAISSNKVTCSGASKDSPDTDAYHCEGTPTSGAIFPLPFQHKDRIEFTYEAKNGGFVKVRNKENNELKTYYYNSATKTHTFSMSIDLEDPYHCTGTAACVNTMLTAPNLIKTSTVNLRWSAWKDNDAGIDHFLIEVYELHAVGKQLTDKGLSVTKTVSSSTLSDGITLPGAGIYSVLLSAYDKAGNHKSTRRILIYDGTSSVTTRVNTKLQVTTASTASSQWQTASSSPVSVDWTDRYTNTLHHNNKWLLGVASVTGVDSQYDDKEGDRTVNPISNVYGITRFTTCYKIDHKGGSSIESTPNDLEFTSQVLRQSQTITPSLVDGDTLRFWVRAYDVMSNYKEESVFVHIDTSPPIIENLWLTRGDRLDISVHRIEDLNEMTMEWIAYDVHSGLETVSWRVLDKYNGRNIVHGMENIQAQGETNDIEQCMSKYASAARGANCYCTPAMGCYHRHFQVKPRIVDSSLSHGGIFSDKAKGVHDSDYHLEVTVTNHAKLTKMLQFKITIDASPPATGHVHDGLPEQPEIDHQNSLQLHAHWEGFFDKESGVKFYQYKFGPQCLTATDFGLDDLSLKVNETTLTSVSWRAPSAGKYYVTVVAYNRAMEPSDPVCSDGVTIDTTPPSLSEVAVEASRVVEGLVKTSDGSVWLIDVQRRRIQISEPDSQCRAKASDIDDEALTLFPQHRFINQTTDGMNKVDCVQYSALPTKFIDSFYVYKEKHLLVNWTGSDSESGIYDYELGLMSDPSGETAPDILSYTSTHHHPQYQGYHPGLSEGQQFYIGVKATNKAGISFSKVLGPVIVHTVPPVFTGPITVSLSGDYLIAQWTEGSFTDPESAYLTYQVAVGTKDMGTVTLPFGDLKSGDTCTLTSPPTCTAIAVKDLHWDLHHSHTYFVSVRVTNIVGLSTVGVSEPYVHDVRLPSRGVVIDVCPESEQSLFEITNYEDTDHQISTSSLSTKWYGFDNGLESITYKVGIGSKPSASDIKGMVDVGNKETHEFTGLKLKENEKYYVTVEARTGAGKTTVSSDGVVIVKDSVDMSHVVIRDGPGCSTLSDGMINGNNKPACTHDSTYQVSSSIFAAHWRRSDSDREKYPDVFWSLQEKLPHSDKKWQIVRDYEHLGTSEKILTGGVVLEPGYTYRAAVKFCAARVCSLPTYSDGVTVIPHPPKPGSISLKYEETGSKSQIHVTIDKFRDPDILLKSESYDIMDRYEWSLPDDSHSSRLLEGWKEVVASTISSDGEKASFSINLPKRLDFSKCRRLSVKGYNKVGVYTVLSTDIKNCSAYDPAVVIPALIIDAVGMSKGADLGYSVSLDQNNAWGLPDADYTPYKNILSAVWPNLRHRNYTWAVVSGDMIDPTSHYKRENIMTVSDPCSLPDVVKCGTTANEYINVMFPTESYLRHGQRFYICIHADEMNTSFEKWTAELAEVNSCSNGITVDLTAPEVGTVTVEGLNADNIQVSTTEVHLRWQGFTDVEEERAISHSSGISHYEVALGSISGGEDIVKFSNVGLVDHVTLHSLRLHSGATVYASVRATDFVNKTTTVQSEGFLVDATPPLATAQKLQMVERYITSRLIHVCWVSVFTDEESGLKFYMVALGTKPGYDDISTYTFTDQTCTDVDTFNKIKEGHSYYISVKGYNKAGLYKLVTSRPLAVSSSPPPTGHVYDGRTKTADNKDKDFVMSSFEMGAHWEGFQDPNSPIAVFKVKVGTCAGCDDKTEEFEYGSRKDITFNHTSFSPGVKYYTTVTACSVAGLCSSSTSDGVILDSTDPVPGTVDDGTGDVDIQFQASRTFVGCKWRGFYDPESGLDHYEWRVGTSPGGDEILTPRNAALEDIAFHTLQIDKQLPVGQRLYITVRAYNKAGSYTEATSNGFIVDDSPPTVVTSPMFTQGFASSVIMTTVSRTTLSVQWEFRDQESFIDRQYLSISSHELGEFNRSVLVVPSFIKQFVFTGLDLHDGSKYKVKVTACNMAGLCASDATQDIHVDSSKPKTGTLAVETAHAARLTRHQFGGMTWTSDSLKLSWLGFSDLHSGVHHYIVTIGSEPFGRDLNKDGTQTEVSHKTSGVDKGDEGVVQTAIIPTKTLKENGAVFVAIWAVNGVGLKSDPHHAQLTLDGDRILWLVRRCQAYNCEGHCVCAVQSGTCRTSGGCVTLNNGGPNSVVTVNDIIDITSDSVDVDFSPLDTVMAATWSVTTSKGLPIQRYEYSIGDCDETTPHGVFDVVNERLWFDAGHETSAILSLPKGKQLTSGAKYCFFIRAWYDARSNSIFKSDGIIIDVTAPSLATKSGFSVKECRDQSSSKDIDYQMGKDKIFINWRNKFLQGHSGIAKYIVYISNKPGGHSIRESSDLTTTSYTATGLSLEPNTVYYSSVLAYNKAGLVSWAYSDGVQVDVVPPVAGMVHDGQDIHDVDYQKSATEISSSWYGFSDSDSSIIKYHWCVGKVNDTTDCSIVDWQNTGLHTFFRKILSSPPVTGTTLWSKVYAEDAVGHTSDIVISNGVTIDTSPPKQQTVAYLGENLLTNPSFEEDIITEDSTNCNVVVPKFWETDSESCIKIVSPDSPVARHRNMFISVSGNIQQTITNLEIGRQYKLSIHTGYPQTVSNNHKPVEATVAIGGDSFSLSLDPSLCKGTCQVGDESVILWNTHTYRFTARDTTSVVKISSASRSMEFVLDHVRLQTVDYGSSSSSSSGETENHLLVHPVFLSHWSSLHASWHFLDTESPIIQYMWAVGTVEGGTQIQGYRNVGRNTQSTAVNLQLSHNSEVHISVVATNAAGLSAKSHSGPITVDMTPPKFDYINDGSVWDDDFLSSSLVVVNWQVADMESGIQHCDWAIGRTKGRSDVKKFERVPPGESKAQHDISDVLNNNTITVYTTVRCFNKAGLVAVASTDGVTILLESEVQHKPVPGFDILGEGESVYPQRGTCHQRQDRVRLHWDRPNLRLKSFVVGVEGENITYQNNIANKLDYTFAELAALKLTQRTSYEAISFPVDVLGSLGEITTANFTVHGSPPAISTSGDVTVTRGGTELTLSWDTVFTSPWDDLLFEVQIGSVAGGADVVDRMLTTEEYLKLTLNPSQNNVKDIFVSIVAVDPCGLGTFYSKQIAIAKST